MNISANMPELAKRLVYIRSPWPDVRKEQSSSLFTKKPQQKTKNIQSLSFGSFVELSKHCKKQTKEGALSLSQ